MKNIWQRLEQITPPLRLKSYILAPLLVCAIIIFSPVMWRQSVWFADDTTSSHLRITNDWLSIVDASMVAIKPENRTTCVRRSMSGLLIPICLYPANKDVFISAKVARTNTGYFESVLVSNILSMLRQPIEDVQDAASRDVSAVTFIDIGANVGSYSLAVAHQGSKVIAIEPNWSTLRLLATSVVLGRLTERVTILHNAVTNDTSGSIVHLGVHSHNQGRTWILEPDHCRRNPKAVECSENGRAGVVGTITLNDLLSLIQPSSASTTRRRLVIMKVDAEGSECKIFDEQTAANFMAAVDVVAIQMEWQWMSQRLVQSQDVNKLLKFLGARNYTVHAISSKMHRITEKDWTKWPLDVMFLRNFK